MGTGGGGFSALEAKAGKLTDLKVRLGNIMRCSSPPPHPKTNQKRAERKLYRWSEITGNREETCWYVY